eukprot:TRINITY_DN15210_c0_g1_i7.p1 TRINITY_DN15210_c0_g1~~TRINITY_DN15210_c0_g1_i7.p1  ORF type:complete len:401 (+),score=80.68 TRINITY_DN15210_c0_g1_i7:1063-2265(+)
MGVGTSLEDQGDHLPTFFLEPRSLLEQHTDFWAYPQLLFGVGKQDDPLKRMLQVLRWFISGWHIRPKSVKKPYNPIQGEVFKASWEFDRIKCKYVAEQISSYPQKNVFAVYFEALPHFEGCATMEQTAVWSFNSISFNLNGTLRLTLTSTGEVYEITLPSRLLKGLVYGKLSLQFVGTTTITCPSTGYVAKIDFLPETWTSNANSLKGTIFKSSSSNSEVKPSQFYNIEGAWDSVINVIDLNNNYSAVLFDPATVRFVPKTVKSVSEQDDFESRKLWQNVTSALKKLDHAEATVERRKLHSWAIKQQLQAATAAAEPAGSGACSPTSDADSSLSGSKHDVLPRFFKLNEDLEDSEEYVIRKERLGPSPSRTESQDHSNTRSSMGSPEQEDIHESDLDEKR